MGRIWESGFLFAQLLVEVRTLVRRFSVIAPRTQNVGENAVWNERSKLRKFEIPSSKLTWLAGNSPFPMGNTSLIGGFFIAMLVYQHPRNQSSYSQMGCL